MSKDIEETNSGVKKRGKWKEVAEFGEEVEEAMEESNMSETSVEEFQEWRPKTEEAENDMLKKTVDQASMNDKRFEEESNGVEDIKDASGKMAEAGKKAVKIENPEPEIKEASKGVLRPLMAKSTEFARDIEEEIYSKIMLRFNPFYLDTGDMTVDFRPKKNGEYQMDVNLSEDESREKIKRKFREEQND